MGPTSCEHASTVELPGQVSPPCAKRQPVTRAASDLGGDAAITSQASWIPYPSKTDAHAAPRSLRRARSTLRSPLELIEAAGSRGEGCLEDSDRAFMNQSLP